MGIRLSQLYTIQSRVNSIRGRTLDTIMTVYCDQRQATRVIVQLPNVDMYFTWSSLQDRHHRWLAKGKGKLHIKQWWQIGYESSTDVTVVVLTLMSLPPSFIPSTIDENAFVFGMRWYCSSGNPLLWAYCNLFVCTSLLKRVPSQNNMN